MYDYVEPYPTCDKILNVFIENGSRLEESTLFGAINGNGGHFRSAIQQLEKDGCIKHDSNSGNWYLILGTGTQTQSTGGYKEKFERLRITDAIKSQIDELNIITAKSTVDTNNAVINSLRITRKIGWWAVVIAAVSAFGTIGNLYVSCQSQKPPQSKQSPHTTNTPIKSTPIEKDHPLYRKDSIEQVR